MKKFNAKRQTDRTVQSRTNQGIDGNQETATETPTDTVSETVTNTPTEYKQECKNERI